MTTPSSIGELIERLRRGVTWSDGKRIDAVVGAVNDPVMSEAADTLERLRDALTFYAKPEIYRPHPHGPAFERRDLSFVAREALTAKGNRGDD